MHDFVMASEYVAVSRIRDALATVPSRYLKAVKTDCVVFQDLPKKFQGLVDGLVRQKHPDGTPVYRCEEVKGLEGQYRIPRIEAECMCNIDTWKVAEDPVLHCLEGGSLLLTGCPGTRKTYLARQIVTALREEGYKVKIITKTHSSVQNFGMQAETADHWVRSTVRNGYCNIDWLVAEEITQLDTGLWNDIACVSMNRNINFLLLGDFVQPTICADIQEWDYRTYPPGHFDLIWASPVCTEFSRALTRRPRRLTEGDGLVLKTIEIIGYLRPRWWAVENPRTGLLKSRPYMQALPYNDVSYCMYGFRYQKSTRIWNNLPWVPSQPICSKRSRCEAL